MTESLEKLRATFGRLEKSVVIVRLPTVILRDTEPEYTDPSAADVRHATQSLNITPEARLLNCNFNSLNNTADGPFTSAAFYALLSRAESGNQEAFNTLAINVRSLTNELNRIATKHEKIASQIGQTLHDWPVVLSQLDSDFKAARAFLKRLRIGTKSPISAYPGQKRKRDNFWTKLAEGAVAGYRINVLLFKECPQALQDLEHDLREESIYCERFFGEEVEFRKFVARDGTTFLFKKWMFGEEHSGRIDLKKHWPLLRESVLEFWWRNPPQYRLALDALGRSARRLLRDRRRVRMSSEWQKRKRALEAIKQALKSVVADRV